MTIGIRGLLFCVLSLIVSYGWAASWIEVDGSASGGGVSDTAAVSFRPSMAVSPSGEIAVAWEDGAPPNQHIYLRVLAGGAWAELNGSASGTGVDGAAVDAYGAAVTYDSLGRLLIAYATNSGSGQALHMKRWNGTSWDELDGSATGSGLDSGSTALSSTGTCIAVDSSDNPIVGWTHGNYPASDLKVFHWNGVSWTGASPSPSGYNYSPSIARGTSGEVWLACDSGIENGSTADILVLRYSGSTWTQAGTLSAEDHNKRPSIAVDSQNRPVVAWMSGTLASGAYSIMVARYDSGIWTGLAGSNTGDGISDSAVEAGLPGVAIGQGDVPVVAFTQDGTSPWVRVRAFNGVSWEEFGDGSDTEPGLSSGAIPPVVFRSSASQDDGWYPGSRTHLQLATSAPQQFFCAWERDGLDEVYGKQFQGPIPVELSVFEVE